MFAIFNLQRVRLISHRRVIHIYVARSELSGQCKQDFGFDRKGRVDCAYAFY